MLYRQSNQTVKSKLLVPILVFIILGAFRPDHQIKIVPLTFPDSPVNMVDINSVFDDYNSTTSIYGPTFPLCFSSNRNSSGRNFDIIYKLLDVYASVSDGKLTVEESPVNYLADVDIENNNLTYAIILRSEWSFEASQNIFRRK